MATNIPLVDFPEQRDIVFSPNLVSSLTFGKVYWTFMRTRGRTENQTCKKTAKPGDLYLFYFGEPECKIAGLAVCSQSPDPKGWKKPKWTNRQRMFFCPMDALYHCNTPVTADDFRANQSLASWWETKPYRGRPKTLPPDVAATLLQLIAKREPKVATLLNGYTGGHKVVVSGPNGRPPMDAWEGTRYERLAQQRVRSQTLRDEKIRRSTDKDGHLVCEVPGCEFDFFETYGEIGRGFAHVHHRRPLAKSKRVRSQLADLAIVCANCHAMIHRDGQCRRLQGLVASDTQK